MCSLWMFSGEYGIHVKYDDEHVPDSPEMVYVAPEAGDAKLCTVHGLRDRGLDVSSAFLLNFVIFFSQIEISTH